MSAVLVADELYRFFHIGDEETRALRGVSLSVAPGELVAVVGPSGSGKSTLLACLAGLDEPDGGTVHIAGKQVSRRPESERALLRARHAGVVFQTANLIEHLTVRDNVAIARRFARGSDAATDDLFTRLAIVDRARAHPSELSGGELARAGLAVALANEPEVLLADEPTGELDSTTASVVLDLLRETASRGAAVFVVTHNEDLADEADRTLQIRDGQVQL